VACHQAMYLCFLILIFQENGHDENDHSSFPSCGTEGDHEESNSRRVSIT
jgi:hypothetical protein